jgi:hypothetical protein
MGDQEGFSENEDLDEDLFGDDDLRLDDLDPDLLDEDFPEDD